MCLCPPLNCLPILPSMLLLPSFLLLSKEFLAQGRQFAIQSFAPFLTSCWTSLLLPSPSFLCLSVCLFFMFYLLFSCLNIVTLICYVITHRWPLSKGKFDLPQVLWFWRLNYVLFYTLCITGNQNSQLLGGCTDHKHTMCNDYGSSWYNRRMPGIMV